MLLQRQASRAVCSVHCKDLDSLPCRKRLDQRGRRRPGHRDRRTSYACSCAPAPGSLVAALLCIPVRAAPSSRDPLPLPARRCPAAPARGGLQLAPNDAWVPRHAAWWAAPAGELVCRQVAPERAKAGRARCPQPAYSPTGHAGGAPINERRKQRPSRDPSPLPARPPPPPTRRLAPTHARPCPPPGPCGGPEVSGPAALLHLCDPSRAHVLMPPSLATLPAPQRARALPRRPNRRPRCRRPRQHPRRSRPPP